ncbi:MAG TPA: gas vesicle protein GvpJ [Vicinamibacterales bacterium]|nr:gas vesicle protein GvpJ [Vicinamibacterales bacterium]
MPVRSLEVALHSTPVSVRSQSLLDVVDNLIDKGVALDAEVVLGLADVDLLYLRAGALLAAADRVFPKGKRSRRVRPAAPVQTLSAPSASRPLISSPARSGSAMPVPTKKSAAVARGRAPVESDETSRSVIRLVLTLVEFVRQLLERQAVRRVREKTLTAEEVERLGTALMHLESTVHELAERHGLDPTDLNLDLGPLGTLR